MKKRVVVNSIIIFVCIMVALSVAVYKLFGESSKEIHASKEFMSKLYSINAIDTSEELTDLKYEKLRNINSQNELVNKTIMTQNYGIDLDKNNNVVGFAKKDIKKSFSKLSEIEGRRRAEKYLEKICGNDLIYVNEKDDNDLPYYSFIYMKKQNGYKLYLDEIKVNINKESGYLDGYSNTTMQKVCKDPKISIDEKEAVNIAYNYFEKYNISGQVLENTELVYADDRLEGNESNNLELCYLVDIESQNSDELDVIYKIFVNADNGKVFNCIKENVEKEVLID